MNEIKLTAQQNEILDVLITDINRANQRSMNYLAQCADALGVDTAEMQFNADKRTFTAIAKPKLEEAGKAKK